MSSYSLILPAHIAGGIVGIAAGTAAMLLRKGSARHALAGKVFVAAMLTMAAAAAYLATLKHQPGNIFGGIFTFYLILTAWLTARMGAGKALQIDAARDAHSHDGDAPPVSKTRSSNWYDYLLMLIPLVLGILGWFNAVQVVRGHAIQPKGVPVGMSFFLSTVMLLAAAGDIRMLLSGGVPGGKRIIRHLWRMCFGLFIATGSFFLGQQQVFPRWMRGSLFLFILAVLPLPLLIFWLFRFRFGKSYAPWRMQSSAQGTPATAAPAQAIARPTRS